MHEVPLEEGKRLGRCVVVLDPVRHLWADLADVAADLLVEVRVVDHDAAVVPVELLSEHSDGQIELSIQQSRLARPLRLRIDGYPSLRQLVDVALELIGGRPLGCRPDDEAMPLGPDLIEDLAKSLALVVAEEL